MAARGQPEPRDNLRIEAARRGVGANRLVFAQRMPLAEHLARHRLADLFLDTLPYNAHTTASDALWAGLPVLTCLGETFAGRVGASLLNAVGLPELITRTPEQYEAVAIDLANNPGRLERKSGKRWLGNRLTAPLFDARLFAAHIEAAYRTMYESVSGRPGARAHPRACQQRGERGRGVGAALVCMVANQGLEPRTKGL